MQELYDHKLEQGVIGAVLIDPNSYFDVSTLVDADMFHDARHKWAWEAINNLHNQKKSIDILTVNSELEATGHNQDVPQAYLLDLINSTPTSLHAKDYAQKVREFAIRRKMVYSASLIAQYGYDLTKPVDDLLVGVRKQVDNIESYGLRSDLEIPNTADIAIEFASILDDINKGIIKTYIPKLDMAIGGFDLGTITVLASVAAMGKSSLAFQISRNLATRKNEVIYFSNEMTRMQLWIKATCGSARIAWRDVKRDGVTEGQKELLIAHSSQLVDKYEHYLHIDDRTDHTTSTIWQACRKYHPKFVVVDVLQNLNDKGDKEVDRLGEIIKQLKFIAKDVNCHLLALTHVNRSVEFNKGKIPTMAELRDSGKLENTADNVLLLTSDDYYVLSETPKDHWKSKLIIGKCKDGIKNVQVNLFYSLKDQWFYDTDPDEKIGLPYKEEE